MADHDGRPHEPDRDPPRPLADGALTLHTDLFSETYHYETGDEITLLVRRYAATGEVKTWLRSARPSDVGQGTDEIWQAVPDDFARWLLQRLPDAIRIGGEHRGTWRTASSVVCPRCGDTVDVEPEVAEDMKFGGYYCEGDGIGQRHDPTFMVPA